MMDANKNKRRRRRSDSAGSEGSDDSEQHPAATTTATPESPKIVVKNRRRRRKGRRSKKHQEHEEGNNNNFPKPSEYVALDCEMVGVGESGQHSSVARVTVIDWSGTVLFDQVIQQTEPVTDYRTFVSGITPQMIQDATISLTECQEIVTSILQGHILVGHALKNDLRALGITHPWWLTRDTAKYEPFMKVRFDDGILWPRKLKDLVHEKLQHEIQVPGRPHCPYEDAMAALDLYRTVRSKWESVMVYKIEKTKQIRQQQLEPQVLEQQ
eukprot:scaffold1073_cov98-Cylindrotheca_fusiformis.AAC.7